MKRESPDIIEPHDVLYVPDNASAAPALTVLDRIVLFGSTHVAGAPFGGDGDEPEYPLPVTVSSDRLPARIGWLGHRSRSARGSAFALSVDSSGIVGAFSLIIAATLAALIVSYASRRSTNHRHHRH
ncbi:MAG: hypothetical protein U0Q16_04820 [Bryobacteraceae bacterium]